MNTQHRQRPRILRPAMDGLAPGVVPDPDDSPVVAALCDLIAEILAGALLPAEVHSPSPLTEERHATQADHPPAD